MTLNELKSQIALGTLDVLQILDAENLTELPIDIVNALAQLYLILLKACPYFYDWIETDTRMRIYTKLCNIQKIDNQILKELKLLTPPFFDFRDSL